MSIEECASNARRRAAAGQFHLAQLARHAAAAGDDPRPAPPPAVVTAAGGGADRSDPRFDAAEERLCLMWMARRRLHFSRAAEAVENDELRNLRASRGVAGGEAGGEPNLLEGCVPRPAADAAKERRRRAAAAAAAAAADDAAAAGSECLEELGRREPHARVAVCEPEQREEEDGDEAAAVGALKTAILRQRHGDVRERDKGGGGAGDGGGVGARPQRRVAATSETVDGIRGAVPPDGRERHARRRRDVSAAGGEESLRRTERLDGIVRQAVVRRRGDGGGGRGRHRRDDFDHRALARRLRLQRRRRTPCSTARGGAAGSAFGPAAFASAATACNPCTRIASSARSASAATAAAAAAAAAAPMRSGWYAAAEGDGGGGARRMDETRCSSSDGRRASRRSADDCLRSSSSTEAFAAWRSREKRWRRVSWCDADPQHAAAWSSAAGSHEARDASGAPQVTRRWGQSGCDAPSARTHATEAWAVRDGPWCAAEHERMVGPISTSSS